MTSIQINREKWKNLTFYCIYTRNHSESGTFQSIIDDLPRLVQMGIDVVWLLPIHPIGKTNRKGTLGSPYSIDDFRQVNPEHGNLDDFRRLLSSVHQHGLRLMIDIVFRHTSHDCSWAKEHPEWYLRDDQGKPIALVPGWTDILDLKFEGNEDTLWKELIDILQYWCQLGVDGFRMDVASAVTMKFWHQARETVSKTHPNVIWLAESTRFPYIERHRSNDVLVNTDSTLYQVFDICYDYDLYGAWRATIADALPIKSYMELVRLQSVIYAEDFIKLRFVENHDQRRVSHILENNRYKVLAWTAFSALNKGCFLVHAGQETEQNEASSLFEKSWVDCKQTYSLGQFIQKLIQIKKHPIIQSGNAKLTITHCSPCLALVWESNSDQEGLICLFNVEQKVASNEFIHLPSLPDGNYSNLLTDLSINNIPSEQFPAVISVTHGGQIPVPAIALVLHYTNFLIRPRMFHSDLFDFRYSGM